MKKQYLTILKKCEALLTKNEAEFLLNATKIVPEKGVIVDIGSYKGGSAFLLAKGSKMNKKGKVYTIEPDIYNFEFLKQNMEFGKIADWVIPVNKTSEKAVKNWKKTISLLFIDGDHNYKFLKMDFLLWEKYLVNGGIIAFHDSRDSENKILFRKVKHDYYDGPRRVVQENILNSKRFKNVKIADTITYAKKIRDRNAVELLKGLISLYNYKLITFPKRLDRKIGELEIFLKEHFPKLYFKLKKFKNEKKFARNFSR